MVDRNFVKSLVNITNIKVNHMYFNELSIVNKYDGIWACSSILHLSLDDLVDVLSE